MTEITADLSDYWAQQALNKPLLQAKGLTKRFGSLTANDAVSLDIGRGEIHALLGENGAGKSTLVKMLYGALQPDEGLIAWGGRPVIVPNPSAARELGVGMVFQHFSLFEALTVAENIALALPPGLSLREISDRAESTSAQYGLSLRADSQISDLSVGERQRVEIVRCLMQDPQLIIMDEPTSVLTTAETDALFETLLRLRDEGKSLLYISHKLAEVKQICSAATVLRHGKNVGSCDPRVESPASLARMMVGDDVDTVRAHPVLLPDAEAALELKSLNLPRDNPFGTDLVGVELTIRFGEVAAIAGIAGNGQGELFDAISGERPVENEALELFGEPSGKRSITARRRAGAAFVPEERLGHGSVPTASLSDNIVLSRGRSEARLGGAGFLRWGTARRWKDRIVEQFDVRKGGPDPAAGSLSGGNLQKFLVGREFDSSPRLLVINQPTWGVDAGAAAHIRKSIVEHARGGAGVLIISQDLDEIFEVADRVAVLAEGHLSHFMAAADTDREDIGLLLSRSVAATSEAEIEQALVTSDMSGDGPSEGASDHAR
ncbi:MAG: ABC transporter ATP-binding protein [Pseudomonadota bacterium]